MPTYEIDTEFSVRDYVFYIDVVTYPGMPRPGKATRKYGQIIKMEANFWGNTKGVIYQIQEEGTTEVDYATPARVFKTAQQADRELSNYYQRREYEVLRKHPSGEDSGGEQGSMG